MGERKTLRFVEKEGVTTIIINGGRILIMKRISLPFLIHSGIWTFVAGRKERKEGYEETAYREIEEEAGIAREDLRLASRPVRIMKINEKGGTKFHNMLYVFYSRTRRVRKNIENSDYRWATLSEIRGQRRYTNIFADKHSIERIIGRAIDGEKRAKGKA